MRPRPNPDHDPGLRQHNGVLWIGLGDLAVIATILATMAVLVLLFRWAIS